jgi:hypothetical protein
MEDCRVGLAASSSATASIHEGENPPEKTLFPNLPLPSWEKIEVRGSFDKLRMTSLFAMVSLSNHHPHPDPLPSREREISVKVVMGKVWRILSDYSFHLQPRAKPG